MNFQDINKKLENVRDLIKGEDYEKNINRLNTVLKYATEAWLLLTRQQNIGSYYTA